MLPEQHSGGSSYQADSKRAQSGQTEASLKKQNQPGTESSRPQGQAAAQPKGGEHPEGRAPAVPDAENKAVTNGAQTPGAENGQPAAASDQPQPQAGKQPPGKEGADAAEVVQKARRKVLALCQSLALADHETLSMNGYPDNEVLEIARRRRDLWAILCCLFGIIFALGMSGLIHAVITGLAAGALAATLSLAVPQIRRLYMDTPSHAELLQLRRELERNARAHIKFLEGKNGLACNFQMLCDYNGALHERGYQWLMQLSERKMLMPVLRGRARIRLYQHLLYEAEKGYERLKEAYLAQENARAGIGPEPQEQSAVNPDAVPAATNGQPAADLSGVGGNTAEVAAAPGTEPSAPAENASAKGVPDTAQASDAKAAGASPAQPATATAASAGRAAAGPAKQQASPAKS